MVQTEPLTCRNRPQDGDIIHVRQGNLDYLIGPADVNKPTRQRRLKSMKNSMQAPPAAGQILGPFHQRNQRAHLIDNRK